MRNLHPPYRRPPLSRVRARDRPAQVYLEPSALGLQPLLDSWLQRLPAEVAPYAGQLGALFNALVPEGLAFVRKQLKASDEGASGGNGVLGDGAGPAIAQLPPPWSPRRAGPGLACQRLACPALPPSPALCVPRCPQETVSTVPNNLVASCLGLMDALLRPQLRTEGQEPLSEAERLRLGGSLPSLMLFSIVWSVGATCDKAGRAAFDAWFRAKVADCGLPLQRSMFPDTASVYDWVYDASGALTGGGEEAGAEGGSGPGWVGWMATVPEFRCDPERPFAEIIVPTADTVRYTYLLDRCAAPSPRGAAPACAFSARASGALPLAAAPFPCHVRSCVPRRPVPRVWWSRLVAAGRHVLVVGETGTGKSLNVANKLLNDMPPEVSPVFMTFSARTSANQTQVQPLLSVLTAGRGPAPHGGLQPD
jgi:hypothetical protein